MENVGLTTTPMGVLLNSFGSEDLIQILVIIIIVLIIKFFFSSHVIID
jgi:hypothetical protein